MLIADDARLQGLEEQLEAIREENRALRSALCGLYVGISQMSDIHDAIAGQALDFAARIAKAQKSRKPLGPSAANDGILEEIRGAIIEYRLMTSRPIGAGRLV